MDNCVEKSGWVWEAAPNMTGSGGSEGTFHASESPQVPSMRATTSEAPSL